MCSLWLTTAAFDYCIDTYHVRLFGDQKVFIYILFTACKFSVFSDYVIVFGYIQLMALIVTIASGLIVILFMIFYFVKLFETDSFKRPGLCRMLLYGIYIYIYIYIYMCVCVIYK